jgi:hypothetical protein
MPLILGTNSIKDTGYNVDNSLRFNDGDSPALTRSLGTTTLTTKGTFSFWVKRGQLTTAQIIYSNEVADDNNRGFIQFEDDDTFRIKDTVSGSNTTFYATSQLFRDTSAWYHMVVALDSTQAGGNRIRVYKNGTRIPDAQFGTSIEPNQNSAFKLLTGGQTNKNHIGKIHGGANHFDGYLAEFVYCDGQVLDATSFGEFDEDSGIWKPKDVSGLTMGDQGFYLDFEDSSALGNDKAGSNNFGTVTNLAATDQTVDTCTNNFATLNPLHFGTTIAASYSNLSEGNLKFVSTQSGSPYPYYFSTMAVSQGKWYAEFKRVNTTVMIGIATGVADSFLGNNANDYAMYESGQTFTSGSGSSYGDAMDDNDIIGVAMDLDNNKLYFSNQGVFQNSGDPTSGSTGTGAVSITAPASNGTGVYHFAVGDSGGGTPTINCNFGSPMESISSGNSDGNGYGNFEYSVPSGYYSLCTKNLAEYG